MKNIKKRFLIGVLGSSLAAFGLGFGIGHFNSRGDDTKNESSQVTDIDETLIKEYLEEYDKERDSVQKEIEDLKAEKERLEKEKEEHSSDKEFELSSEQEALEKEIEELKKQKVQIQNSKNYNISDLIVIKGDLNYDNSESLYILEPTEEKGIYKEIHNTFKGCYATTHSEEEIDNYMMVSNHPQSTKDLEVVEHFKNYYHFYDYEPLVQYIPDEYIEIIEKNNGVINSVDLDMVLENIRDHNNYHKSLDN